MIMVSQPLSGFTLHFRNTRVEILLGVTRYSQGTHKGSHSFTSYHEVSLFLSLICARATRSSLQALIAGPHQKRGIFFLIKLEQYPPQSDLLSNYMNRVVSGNLLTQDLLEVCALLHRGQECKPSIAMSHTPLLSLDLR